MQTICNTEIAMPISTTLFDSEGFAWDFNSDGGLNVVDGQDDAFDNGLRLFVNGTVVNPQNASLDGRELNAAPVMIGGIAVQRSIMVSDATISPVGFARFLDSFTNTTDLAITITVQTITDSGADNSLAFPSTTSGDSSLTADDTGFVTSDQGAGFIPDSVVMIAYGDGSLLPTNVDVSGSFLDVITITHTLTLQPGETQSLLQFATQNNTGNEFFAGQDLALFTQNAFNLNQSDFLTGLSREEMLSIVNYDGFDAVVDPYELTDSEGNLWTIATNGRISAVSGALNDFGIPVFSNNWTTVDSVTVDEAANEVSIVTSGFSGNPDSTVTYDYKSLDDLGVIRLLVTFDNTLGTNQPIFDFSALATGPNGSLIVATQTGSFNNQVIGVVIDDSISGSGGTAPAATVVWGAINFDDTFSLAADTLFNDFQNINLAGGQQHTFLFFLATNTTGIAALADLATLSTPGPRLLEGLSAADVANLRNFDIPEFQGRLQEILGSPFSDIDDIIVGNPWGDSILGDAGDDEISALGSDDVVRGGIGSDDIDGGDGDDSLFGGVDNDTITGGRGNDLIFGEDGTDVLLGQAGNDTMFGGADNETMSGGSGDDLMEGGFGVDSLRGGIGFDTLMGNEDADRLFGGGNNDVLFGGEGLDDLFGGDGNDTLDGGSDNDFLLAGDGADSLIGGNGGDFLGGGDGEDTLFGDEGNDILRGDASNDSLFGGDNDDELFGDSGADTLFGGNGNDTLTGGGAADTDINRLFGGADNDTYFVTSTGDRVSETANNGTADIVISEITYTLTSNVENLTLSGTANINGTGNGLANTLTGNSGNNVLNGGAGIDTMLGGSGNDRYVVDRASDRVFETTTTTSGIDAGGTDTVQSTVSFSLASTVGLSFVERLALSGNANINGTGNALANTITGNSRDNILNGLLGNDILIGGAGADTFVFSTAASAANLDRISDFSVADDTIQIENAVFTGLATGALAASAFASNLTGLATTTSQRIIYESDTGRLYHDADGSGAGARVHFATLTAGLGLTQSDFFIV
jgi:Ca2+-binding RTX toxin-like protein